LFLLVGGYMLYDAWTTPATYKAKLTFMVNEDESNTMSGVSSILGQFGFVGRRGRFNLDKVLELSRSNRIVQEAVFGRIEMNGSEDYLSNHLIELYELDDKWVEKDSLLRDFRFATDSVPAFSDTERKALKRVMRKVVGGEDTPGLIANDYSEESTIMTLSAETENADMSIALVNGLFEALSDFYIRQSTEKEKQTIAIVQAKVDSIGGLLADKEFALASFADANRNLTFQVAELRRQRLQRDIQKLNIMHAEALKNLEIADFSLRNATPFIQVVDKPIAPLQPIVASKMKALIIGLLLALIIGALFIIGGNIREQVLQEN
jgi:uncharacterized protein involved in exopolysaccharide biosynthesis